MTKRKLTKGRSMKTQPLLRNPEGKYKYFCEDGSAIMLMIGADGTVKDVNNVLLEMSGYSRDEVVGMNVLDFVVPEQRKKAAAQIQTALNNGTAPQFEVEFRSKDGSTSTLLLPPRQLVLEEGQRSILVTGIDVTERKRVEEKLLALHKHALQLSSAVNVDGIVNYTLDAMEFALGFDSAYVLLVEGDCLQIRGSRGGPVAFSAQPLDGRGVTVKAANTKTTIRISDTRGEPAYVDPKGYDWTGPPTAVSELVVPVLIYDETVAVLCVDSVRLGIFTDDDQRLLEILAVHVGSVLGRLQYEEKLLALHSHAQRLVSVTSTEEVVEHTLDAMEFTLGFGSADFSMVEAEKGCLRFKGLRGTIPSFSELALDGPGVTVKAANTKRTIRVSDIRKEDVYVDDEGRVGKEASRMHLSELAVPIIMDNETVAVLNLESNRLNAFTDNDQRLLETLATHVASCLRRLKQEEALRENEERFRKVFTEGPLGIALVRPDYRFAKANKAFCTMLGYTEEELTALKFTDLTHPEDITQGVELTEKMRRGEIPSFSVEKRYIKKNGEVLSAKLVASFIRDRQGAPMYSVAMIEDITDRKQAEEALRESEERYRLLFQRMLEGFAYCKMIFDDDGCPVDFEYLAVNHAFSQLTGLEDVVGRRVTEVIPGIKEENPELFDIYGRVALTGKPEKFEIDLKSLGISLAVSVSSPTKGNFVAVFENITDRKRAEEKLRESEEKYRALVENSSNIVLILQDDALKYVNRAACERLGWTFEEMTSPSFNPVDKMVPETFRPVVKENISRRLRGEQVPPYEVNVATRDGSELPVIVRGERITYLGKVADAITLVDISDRKHVEETVRRRAEEMTALQGTVLEITRPPANSSSLLMAIVERAVKLLGARSGGLYLCDPVKREAACIVSYNTPHDYRGVVLKYGEGLAGRVAETGKPIIIEDYRKWEGRAQVYENDRPFGAVLSVPLMWQGQVTGVIHVMEEEAVRRFTQADLELLSLFANHAAIAVENRRHSESLEDLVDKREKELRATKERLESVVASNPAAIYSGKPLPDYSDRHLTYLSDRVIAMLGFEPQEFIGHPEFWEQHVHPDDLHLARSAIPRFFREGHLTFDYRFLHKDGTYRWIREEARLVRDTDGKPIEVDGYWIDITELKRLEQQLAESERLAAIGQTAAMVGHDLRNPLQGIAGAIHLLKQESLTAKERNEILQLIQGNVEYSDAIVRDLSDYSAEIHLKLAETIPKSITRDAIKAVKVPKIVTLQDLSEDKPTFRVDRGMMRRVFINLIENAIEAMPQGGTLTIGSKQLKDDVQIDFSDTGLGMPEKAMQNFWKPLQTTKARGLGLGLAICKRIMDAHGGTISVKSKLGEGTTVTIRLPIKPEAAEVKQK